MAPLPDLQFILIAAFGSAIQELVYLYDIRSKLHLPDTSVVLKSWQYWVITLAMIVASGIGTWLLYGDSISVQSAIFILGAAFPIIFKKLVASAGSQQQVQKRLSKEAQEPSLRSFSLSNYFYKARD